jgi:hypothetical protein
LKLTYEERGILKKVLIHIANIILGIITIGFSGIMWVALVGIDQVPWYIASILPLLNILIWLVCYRVQVKYYKSKNALIITIGIEITYILLLSALGNS